jgi:hypothetical protein
MFIGHDAKGMIHRWRRKFARRDKGFTTRADEGSEQHCSCMKWSGKASEQFSQPNQAPKQGAGINATHKGESLWH